MRWAPLVAALALAGGASADAPRASAGAAARAGALDALCDAIAREAAALAPPAHTLLAIAVEAPVERLASAGELSLARALRAAGFAPPFAAADAAAAEAQGADAFLAVRIGLQNGSVAAAGELRPVRRNFFTGEALVAGGAVAAAVEADEPVRLLARAGPLRVTLSPFARLAEAPLAVAAGPLGGAPHVAAITRDEIVLWDGRGREVVRHPLPPPAANAAPSRDPRAGLVIAGDRVRWAVPSRGRAQVLRLSGDLLVAEAELPADVVPLAAGAGWIVSAQPVAGTNLFASPLLVAGAAAPAAPRAVEVPTPFVAALAPGVVIEATGRIAVEAVALEAGDAGALADLDGDGVAELVVTSRSPAAPDRVRVLSLGPVVEHASVDAPEPLLCAAAGDLGRGRDEVILAGAGGTLFLLRRAP